MIKENSWFVFNRPQWVVVGGGYAGTLAAWFKAKYPDMAVAAWASSAILKA